MPCGESEETVPNAANRRRMLALSGIAVAVTASLVGCTADVTPAPTAAPTVDSRVVVGSAEELTSFNPAAAGQNTDINAQIYYATHDTFGYLDDTMQIIPNEGFGTVEKISDDPLTVKYTLQKGLKWSDGQPITADDLLFGWAVTSGYFDDATFGSTGTVTSGTRYFTPATTTAGLRDTAVPTVSDDKLTLTLVYDLPTVDWNLNWLVTEPVHAVAKKAGVSEQALLSAIRTAPKGNPAKPAARNALLQAAAAAWNTGFSATALPSDSSLYLSSGPFVVESWVPGESLTLKANENYQGTHTPKFSQLVFRFSLGAGQMVSGMKDHTLDIVSPTGSAATRTALKALDGTQVLTGPLLTSTRFDIQFAGVYTDPDVRQALMKVVPRKDLVDELVRPVDPDAASLDSHVYLSSQTEPYKSAVAQNGSGAYGDVDPTGAKALLAGRTPALRILYDVTDPAQVAVFDAIKASASAVGFVVVDAGSAQWRAQLGGNGYDALIATSTSTGVGNGLIPQMFASEGAENFTGINVPQINKLSRSILTMTDVQEVEAASIKVDTQLFANFSGLPLFQTPGITAHANRVSGVTFMAGAVGELWNFWEWSVSAASPAP